MPRLVYFAQDQETGLVKIGCSASLKDRIWVVGNTTQRSLTVLATIGGGFSMETTLHQLFAADRVEGEWFRPVPALQSLIDYLNESADRRPETVAPTRAQRVAASIARVPVAEYIEQTGAGNKRCKEHGTWEPAGLFPKKSASCQQGRLDRLRRFSTAPPARPGAGLGARA